MNSVSQQIFFYLIRVSKEDSAFTYFILEALEGVCFYSTRENSLHHPYRDIEIRGTIEFEEEWKLHLEQLRTFFPVSVLERTLELN